MQSMLDVMGKKKKADILKPGKGFGESDEDGDCSSLHRSEPLIKDLMAIDGQVGTGYLQASRVVPKIVDGGQGTVF